MLGRIKAAIYPLYNHYLTYEALVEGTLVGDDKPSRSLLVMDRGKPLAHDLLGRLYGDSWRLLDQRRCLIPLLQRGKARLRDGATFRIAVVPAAWRDRLARHAVQTAPVRVRQVIDLSGDWADIRGRFLQTTRKSVFNQFMRSDRFSPHCSNTIEELDRFHATMYQPHARRQFGPAAQLSSRSELQHYLAARPGGFLLWITEGARDVAGALCRVDGDTMSFHRGGVLDGDESLVHLGAQTALYVALFRHAKAAGVRWLDLGTSRPYMDDGVYRYKRSWGAAVSADEGVDRWLHVFDPGCTPQAARVLHQLPMVVAHRDGLRAAYTLAPGEVLDEALLAQLRKRFQAPGLVGLLVRDAQGAEPQAVAFPDAGNSSRKVPSSALKVRSSTPAREAA